MEIRTVKKITGYAAHARFLASIDEPFGFVRRFVGTPYAFSPTHSVYVYAGMNVIIAETAHRTYRVIEVPAGLLVRSTDEEATQDFVAARKAEVR